MNLKPQYRHDSPYGGGARFQRESAFAWEGLPPRAEWPRLIASLSESDDPMDRVRADVLRANLRITLPAVWVVYETPGSPNLNRDPRSTREYAIQDHVWSAHEDLADALAWLVGIREAFDTYIATQGRHWGPSAHRTFWVARVEGVLVNYLRQRGADPRHITAFKHH